MADSESPETNFWDEAADAKEGKAPAVEAAEESLEKKEPAPPPEDEPAVKDAEPEEDASEKAESDPEEDDDPWANVSETLRFEFQEAQKKAEKFEHDARSSRGRLSHLQKKVDELSQKLAAIEQPANDKKTEATDPVAAIFDSADWKKFKEDFGVEVAGPNEAAMRRLFEAMHSRIQQIESQANTLLKDAGQQVSIREGQRLESMYREWADDDSELGDDPAWLKYVRSNYEDMEAFAQASPRWKEVWEQNATLRSADEVFDLIIAFEARKPKTAAATREDKLKPNGSGDKPKPEPRPLPAKRNAQLKSSASPAPRSAPGPGSRSDDLPDPDAYSQSYQFWEKHETR